MGYPVVKGNQVWQAELSFHEAMLAVTSDCAVLQVFFNPSQSHLFHDFPGHWSETDAALWIGSELDLKDDGQSREGRDVQLQQDLPISHGELCVGSASAWLTPSAQEHHNRHLTASENTGEAWQVWEASVVTASGRGGGKISSENSPCWFENEGTWTGWLGAGLHKYYLHYMQGRTHLLMLSSGHWHAPDWGQREFSSGLGFNNTNRRVGAWSKD